LIDDHVVLRNFLVDKAPLAALVGSRIFAGRDTPPVGYAPADGSCLVFARRGDAQDESGAFLQHSYQFKCYGGGETDSAQIINANLVYRALYDVLNYRSSHLVAGGQREGGGQVLQEPDTLWPYVLAFYQVQFRNELEVE
jgi:hypothetical protein